MSHVIGGVARLVKDNFVRRPPGVPNLVIPFFV